MSPESDKKDLQDGFFEELKKDEGLDTVSASGEEPIIEDGQRNAEAESEDGTVLADDELWDTSSGLDEVSLFDDLSEKIEEIDSLTASHGQETSHEEGISPRSLVDGEIKEASTPLPRKDTPEGGDEPGPVVVGERPFLVWGMTAISTLLAAGGIFLLGVMGLFTPYPSPPVEKRPLVPAVTQPTGQTSHVAPSPPVPEKIALPKMETLGLAPFLIPANRDGELVFLNLTVELSLPDAATKREFSRKEAWVRDAILRELKGIDLSSPVAGDFLLPYRKSLLERLNREFAPLRVEDVKLVGFVLK